MFHSLGFLNSHLPAPNLYIQLARVNLVIVYILIHAQLLRHLFVDSRLHLVWATLCDHGLNRYFLIDDAHISVRSAAILVEKHVFDQ